MGKSVDDYLELFDASMREVARHKKLLEGANATIGDLKRHSSALEVELRGLLETERERYMELAISKDVLAAELERWRKAFYEIRDASKGCIKELQMENKNEDTPTWAYEQLEKEHEDLKRRRAALEVELQCARNEIDRIQKERSMGTGRQLSAVSEIAEENRRLKTSVVRLNAVVREQAELIKKLEGATVSDGLTDNEIREVLAGSRVVHTNSDGDHIIVEEASIRGLSRVLFETVVRLWEGE